jgi:hypothetical protein
MLTVSFVVHDPKADMHRGSEPQAQGRRHPGDEAVKNGPELWAVIDPCPDEF